MNKEKIKLVLGGHYSTAIIKHLIANNYKPQRGEIFTPKIIQDIVSGRTMDLEIMQEITNFVIATEKKIQKIKTDLK